MKKFLDLKRSIVDSKNQPTLMQTYLDTIRSSCYKLATPCITPRKTQQDILTCELTKNSHRQMIMNKANGNYDKVSHENASNSMNKSSGQKNKKMTYKYNLSDFMQSTQLSQDSIQQITQNLNNFPHTTYTEYKQKPKSDQIQQIFQTLSSHYKNSNETLKSQKEIIQTIMNNLNMLSKKKEYQQSVHLIKSIIQNMGDMSKLSNNYIANDSQVKNIRYIVQIPEGDGYGSLENSHFKSCMQNQNGEEKIYEGIKQKNSMNQSGSNKNKNIAMKIDWLSPKNNLQLQPMLTAERQKPVVKYTVTKYQPNSHKFNDNQSIYIEDSINSSQSQHKATIQGQNEQYLDNTMKSQDLNQWVEDQLYSISEHEEEQEKTSMESSIIPKQTIEFKKILYMLDSGSTNKKITQFDIQREDQLIKKHLRNGSIHSLHSAKNLFNNKSTTHQQNINKTQQIKSQKRHLTQSCNTFTSKCSSISSSKTNSSHSSSMKSTKKLKQNIKFDEKLAEKLKVNENKGNKSRELQDIVNMLNNKYNRTIKLPK